MAHEHLLLDDNVQHGQRAALEGANDEWFLYLMAARLDHPSKILYPTRIDPCAGRESGFSPFLGELLSGLHQVLLLLSFGILEDLAASLLSWHPPHEHPESSGAPY